MIRVLIVDDHLFLRQSLRDIIDSQEDMEVTGEAENGEAAITETARCHPDVVLMDVMMPVLDGIRATRRIHKEFSDVKIIALSNHTDESYIRKMKAAGASAYLQKDCNRNELIDNVRHVLERNKGI